jgi:hypothetical protein
MLSSPGAGAATQVCAAVSAAMQQQLDRVPLRAVDALALSSRRNETIQVRCACMLILNVYSRVGGLGLVLKVDISVDISPRADTKRLEVRERAWVQTVIWVEISVACSEALRVMASCADAGAGEQAHGTPQTPTAPTAPSRYPSPFSFTTAPPPAASTPTRWPYHGTCSSRPPRRRGGASGAFTCLKKRHREQLQAPEGRSGPQKSAPLNSSAGQRQERWTGERILLARVQHQKVFNLPEKIAMLSLQHNAFLFSIATTRSLGGSVPSF